MLIYKDQVAVRVFQGYACRAEGIGFHLAVELDMICLELFLDVADIVKPVQFFGVFIPAWIEGEDIALEHALEKSNQRVPVFHDEVVHGFIAGKGGKAKLLIELPGDPQVFYAQADGECAQCHVYGF